MRLYLIVCSFLCLVSLAAATKYKPTWDSLDKRPLPDWYDEAKFGIFMHWGVYSVPSVTEWFWYKWANNETEAANYMRNNYKPGFSYADFGPMFTAEFFDAKKFATTIKSSGAK